MVLTNVQPAVPCCWPNKEASHSSAWLARGGEASGLTASAACDSDRHSRSNKQPYTSSGLSLQQQRPLCGGRWSAAWASIASIGGQEACAPSLARDEHKGGAAPWQQTHSPVPPLKLRLQVLNHLQHVCVLCVRQGGQGLKKAAAARLPQGSAAVPGKRRHAGRAPCLAAAEG